MAEKEEEEDILDRVKTLPPELKTIIFQHFQSNMEFKNAKNKIEYIGKTLNDDPNGQAETRDNYILDYVLEINENKFLSKERKNMLYDIIMFSKLTGFKCRVNNHHKWILLMNSRPRRSLCYKIAKYGIFLKEVYSCNGIFMAYLVKSKHDKWSSSDNSFLVKYVVKSLVIQDYYLMPFDGLYLNYLDDLFSNMINSNVFQSYQSPNVFVQEEYLSVENKLKDIPGTFKLQQGVVVKELLNGGYLFISQVFDWVM